MSIAAFTRRSLIRKNYFRTLGDESNWKVIKYSSWKDFVFPRVAEMLIYKEKFNEVVLGLMQIHKNIVHLYDRIGITNINMYIVDV